MPDHGRPLPVIHRETVRPDWIDYNGHMNVTYYTLVFDHATDALFDQLDVGADYVRRANASLFSAENHVIYLREVGEGDLLTLTAQILDFDTKRIHVFLSMYTGADRQLVATSEFVSLHVDMARRRSTPFPTAVFERIEALAHVHAAHPRPPQAGRSVGISS